jgi:hypothetical protein
MFLEVENIYLHCEEYVGETWKIKRPIRIMFCARLQLLALSSEPVFLKIPYRGFINTETKHILILPV